MLPVGWSETWRGRFTSAPWSTSNWMRLTSLTAVVSGVQKPCEQKSKQVTSRACRWSTRRLGEWSTVYTYVAFIRRHSTVKKYVHSVVMIGIQRRAQINTRRLWVAIERRNIESCKYWKSQIFNAKRFFNVLLPCARAVEAILWFSRDPICMRDAKRHCRARPQHSVKLDGWQNWQWCDETDTIAYCWIGTVVKKEVDDVDMIVIDRDQDWCFMGILHKGSSQRSTAKDFTTRIVAKQQALIRLPTMCFESWHWVKVALWGWSPPWKYRYMHKPGRKQAQAQPTQGVHWTRSCLVD